MISITIKDLPSHLHRELKSRALSHGRSLNTEVIACLEASVHSAPVDVEAVLREARAVRQSLKIRLTRKDLLTARIGGPA
jgi:plasmid stability protein